MIKQKKKKIPTHIVYQSKEGYLGVAAKRRYIDWHHCREMFHSVYKQVKYILYYTAHPKETAAFIGHAEKILKLPLKYRTKFYHTNVKNVLYCQLSSWWASSIRQSIFTILLRSGKNYNLKTKFFWKCVKSCGYLQKTYKAFRRFMKGNTYYGSNCYFSGWVNVFMDTSYKLNKLLVKKR